MYIYIYNIYIYTYIYIYVCVCVCVCMCVCVCVCKICDFICDTDNFTTKTCGETFKIQSGILNCKSQKVVSLLKCRLHDQASYVGK